MERRPLALLVVTCFCGSLLACATSRLVTSSGETKLGDELAAQVEQSIGLVRQPKIVSYVEAVGARLVGSSESVRHGLTYQFRVIDMAAPNAFALPGGHLYGLRPRAPQGRVGADRSLRPLRAVPSADHRRGAPDPPRARGGVRGRGAPGAALASPRSRT